MDIISYADIFTALSENRPYRNGLPKDKILELIKKEYLFKHGNPVFSILEENINEIDEVCKSSIRDGINRFKIYEELSEKYAHMVS